VKNVVAKDGIHKIINHTFKSTSCIVIANKEKNDTVFVLSDFTAPEKFLIWN